MTNTMTFHESYGELPKGTLSIIKRYNVSPADFDLMTDLLGFEAYYGNGKIDWTVINDHIVSNSETGMYQPRFF